MLPVASGIKPSQFCSAQHEVAEDLDVQHHQGGDHGEIEQEGRGQLPEVISGADTVGNDGGMMINDQVNGQHGVEVESPDGCAVDGAVGQPPVLRSKRARKPNSKYDPAVYDLDSIEIREIPLKGKKNGWRGIYWPE